MALARTASVALLGLRGALVEVEADLSAQLPGFVLIGLPDAALGEARDRVRAAAANAGCPLPNRKLTVNLSPASLPKHGSAFDLAIALAALAAAGAVEPASVANVVHLGELGLDGRLRPTEGVLAAVAEAVRLGAETVMVPAGNAEEAQLVPGVRIVPVVSLREAAIWHGAEIEAGQEEPLLAAPLEQLEPDDADLAEVIGNDEAIHALLVAAAGGHHLLMLGPPGAGKSMLAARLPGLLPDLDTATALEVSALRSLSGIALTRGLDRRPPFEAPHHSATAPALIGGGSGQLRPGAAARATGGVLFLDEATEFPASVLDTLRQPLETGRIRIHRARATAEFPGRFQLVLAANPCPCGLYGAPGDECTCSPTLRRRYLGRLSGPLLDRIDLQLRLRRITAAQLRMSRERPGLGTDEARSRVTDARARAERRLAGSGFTRNSELPGSWLRGEGRLPRAATADLDRALERGLLTMRGYDRVLRVAWTVADLDGAPAPGADAVGRALALRRPA